MKALLSTRITFPYTRSIPVFNYHDVLTVKAESYQINAKVERVSNFAASSNNR